MLVCNKDKNVAEWKKLTPNVVDKKHLTTKKCSGSTYIVKHIQNCPIS